MNRESNPMGELGASLLPVPTAVLLDQTDVVSLTLRGGIDDAGLRVIPRQSFDQLRGILTHGSYGMIVMTVAEIDEAELDLIERIRDLTDKPLMIVSDTEDLDMRAAAFEAGADEHITSDTGRPEITARIKAKLRRSVPGRDLRSLRTS